MNDESWKLSLEAQLLDITLWKREYIRKQKIKFPNITDKELSIKIKKAKYQKFKDTVFDLIKERT